MVFAPVYQEISPAVIPGAAACRLPPAISWPPRLSRLRSMAARSKRPSTMSARCWRCCAKTFGCISLKNGCEPQASCGCCTLLIDGRPRLSCTMKPSQVAGKTIITLEGLADEDRKQIADAFVTCGGVQCGFCIPGMAMRGYALVEEQPCPTREEIAHELRAHLCRCTGYVKIVDAIEELARVRRGETPRTADTSGRVGTSLQKYRAAISC